MWVYEEADEETEDNLYVHHDVIVPYFPLCLAWLDLDPSGRAPARCFVSTSHASSAFPDPSHMTVPPVDAGHGIAQSPSG